MRIPGALRPYTFRLAQARYNRAQRAKTGKPVVMFTLGKTGSTTITSTIERYVPGRPVYKLHMISKRLVEKERREYARTDPDQRPPTLLAANHLRDRMGGVDVICTVRDPAARAVSAFFQTGERLGHHLNEPETARGELLAWDGLWRCQDWFETDFNPAVGGNVLAEPFDPALGWSIVDTGKCRVLLLRLESFLAAPEALEAFLGVPVPELVKANITGDKGHADGYRAFREQVRLPADVLDRLYGTAYARHFYTAEEIAGFRAVWESQTVR